MALEDGGAATVWRVAAFLSPILFLFVNPFLALFLVALISIYWNVPKLMFLVLAVPSFAMFFFSREYGIEWYPGVSGDDVPAYISLYQSNYGLTLEDLLHRFLEAPNGNEILWHAPWAALLNVFGVSDDAFVFLHYVVIFLTLFAAMRLLSRKYWISLILVYFFLTPLTVDGVAHIWRQQLSFAMFVSGVALKYQCKSRAGDWLICASPLMHVSVIFFVMGYWSFLFLQRFRVFDHKLRFAVSIGIFMTIIPVLSSSMVIILDSLGMARISAFYEDGQGSIFRVYLLLVVYALPMVSAFLLLHTDTINRLFLFLCLAVFSLVLALPGANGIYDRLLMFSLPLMGLFFYRCLICNFEKKWLAPVLFATFVIGSVRMLLPALNQIGVMAFLANGHGFDPTMGLVRLLLES